MAWTNSRKEGMSHSGPPDELESSPPREAHLHRYPKSKHSSVWHAQTRVNQGDGSARRPRLLSDQRQLLPVPEETQSLLDSALSSVICTIFFCPTVIKNNMPYKWSPETRVLIRERMSSEALTRREICVPGLTDLSRKGCTNTCLMIFLPWHPDNCPLVKNKKWTDPQTWLGECGLLSFHCSACGLGGQHCRAPLLGNLWASWFSFLSKPPPHPTLVSLGGRRNLFHLSKIKTTQYLFLECNYKLHCTFFLALMLILKSSVKINCFYESRESIWSTRCLWKLFLQERSFFHFIRNRICFREQAGPQFRISVNTGYIF